MHEELKAQYAEDAAVHPRPWELWFWRTCKNHTVYNWRPKNEPPAWSAVSEYRRHKHADLMIEAHLHPTYEWERRTRVGWRNAKPDWDESLEYRRKHPHAESMKLYAEDAAETDKPWERWEMRNPARTQEWATLDSDVYWVRGFEYRRKNKHQEFLDAVAAGKADEWEVHYKRWATGDWGSGGNEAHVWEIERHQNDWETRRKPQTITVNGREVPVPYKGPLDTDKVYFVASPTAPEYVITASDCIRMCSEWASRGILHLTKEAAVAHAKAMLGADE